MSSNASLLRVFRATLLLLLVAPVLQSNRASAALIVTQANTVPAGFPAPEVITFDDIAPGTDIAGTTIGGVTFTSPDGNTLQVVTAASTFTTGGFTGVIDASTNTLIATSGANVLSPGGPALVPGPALAQRDSLQLDFSTPQSAVGIDILFQSLDIASFMRFDVFGPGLTPLVSNALVTTGTTAAGGAPAGTRFVGFVSDDPLTDIVRVVFRDLDNNAAFPDSNFGYDTLRIARQAVSQVPEPGALFLLGSGLILMAGLAGWRAHGDGRPRALRTGPEV